jgi:hypothetical protein
MGTIPWAFVSVPAHRELVAVLTNPICVDKGKISCEMRRSELLMWFKKRSGKVSMLRGVSVPTAWHVLGLQMEERPPDMEVSCEYIE